MNTLPHGWKRRRLRFDATTNPKKSDADLDPLMAASFVPMEAVGEMGGMDTSLIKEVAEVYKGYTYFADGDVCVAKITPCFENAKGALATGLTNGVAFGTTELHVVRPHHTLDAKFLFYITIAHDFRHIGASEMLGAGGQKRVPEAFIKDWKPPLPPLETQRRIVRFLDEKTALIDALIEKKRALLDRLAEQRQAIITQAVTKGLDPAAPMKDSGLEWLGEIPRTWQTMRLRFLIAGGTRNGLYKSKEQFADDGVAFVQMGEAFRGAVFSGGTKDKVVVEAGELEKWSLRRGDFLIARRSLVFEGSGKSVMIGELAEDHVFESSMIRIRPDRALCPSEFLSYYFQSAVARALFLSITKQVTISGIDGQQLKDILVPVPSSAMKCVQIANFCREQDIVLTEAVGAIGTSVTRLQEYRTGLITAAVTGQVELDAATPAEMLDVALTSTLAAEVA